MANQYGNTFTKVKTITSHVGHGRFLEACACTPAGDLIPLGCIPRPPEIPSPYAYSSTWDVLDYQGVPVIVAETAHKHYVVFRVAGPILPIVFGPDDGPREEA